jgi:hypothetical protein
MDMKTLLIIAIITVIWAISSTMDYHDAVLAHSVQVQQ